MSSRYERRKEGNVDDIRKVVGLEYKGHRLWGVVPGDGTEVWGEYIWTGKE
jgi:hypothetical protein